MIPHKLTPIQRLWLIALVAADEGKCQKNETLIVTRNFFREMIGVKKLQSFHLKLIGDLAIDGYLREVGGETDFYVLTDKAREYVQSCVRHASAFAWRQVSFISASGEFNYDSQAEKTL